MNLQLPNISDLMKVTLELLKGIFFDYIPLTGYFTAVGRANTLYLYGPLMDAEKRWGNF